MFAFFLAVQVDMLRSEGPKLHQNKPFSHNKNRDQTMHYERDIPENYQQHLLPQTSDSMTP